MEHKCKRMIAGILAATIIMSGSVSFDSRATGGSTGGSGGMEGVLSDVFSVVVPTEANRPANENTLYTSAFDFILDPKGLASAAGGSLVGKNLEPNASVYFENLEQDAAYDYSSTSDGFTVINKGMVDVDVTLEATLTGMDGVRLIGDKNFVDDMSASVYLALTDSKGKTSAVDKFGAAIKTTLKGQPNGYKATYNHSTGKYEYQIKSDVELLKDNIKFVDYTFRLTGACNSANSWFKLSGYLEPVISVEWHVAARPKNLAPSIVKTSYVMNVGKALFVDVDLGSGNLAATGISSITYTNSSGTMSTLADSNYVFEDGVLRFRASYISSVLREGVKQRDYTITFNDGARTGKVVKLVANDDIAPSIAQTKYSMTSGQSIDVDMDLGAGALGASGITSITFINSSGATQTLKTDKYTFTNGVLTFNALYIDMMLSNGIASRTHVITLNDNAKTQFSVTLAVDGTEPSIAQTEYRMERGTDVDVAVDLGTDSLAASGISSITFTPPAGGTKTLQTDKYTFANGVLTFKADFINMLFNSGVASRAFTVNFNNVTTTSVVITLTADDIEPSNADVSSFINSGQPITVNVDLGSGTVGATGIKSITFINPTGAEKTLQTDKYTFADGVLTFEAAYIDMLLSNGVTSRTHVVTLNNKLETKMKITLEVDGTGPAIAQADYTMDRGKSIDVPVDLGTKALAATGISTITFVSPAGEVKTLLTDKYTFSNSVFTFKDSFIDMLLNNSVVSRTFTITFNDMAKTQAKVTLKAPDVAPTIDVKEYTMVNNQPLNIKVDLGSGSIGATGIKSITYMDGTKQKTVPTTYYTFADGILKLRASYVNGVISAGITSRDYTITFNDTNGTKEVIKLQK